MLPRRRSAPVLSAVRRAARELGDRRAAAGSGWIARLLGVEPRRLDPRLAEVERLRPQTRAIRSRHLDGGRSSYAQFRAPFELYALVRHLKPRHVVETGVSSGVSSAYFLLGIRRNRTGRLHSIDRPLEQRSSRFGPRDSPVAVPPGRSSGWAVPSDLRRGWDLRLGASERLLPELVAELPSIDLFLHDSHHTPAHLAFELETIRPKLHPGSLVLADNTAWTGAAFPRFARSLGARMVRRGRSDLVGLRVPAG
ncbi:MAG: class I SAM-dependent methyltransferase [Thermoplasmata archaeon]